MKVAARDFSGQEPSSVSTAISEDTVIVTLQDTLSEEERILVDGGRREEALGLRGPFQGAMRAEASSVVAGLTGRDVVAMVCADHIDPTSAGEIFVLDATLGHRR